MANKKKKSKLKKIKDKFIGPVRLTPEFRKQETQDGKYKNSNEGGGLKIDTKFGTFILDKDKNIISSSDSDDFKTSTKRITYGKDFDTKYGKITISGNKGKTKHSGGKSDTKGGKISISKTFKSGGLVKTGKPKLAIKGWK